MNLSEYIGEFINKNGGEKIFGISGTPNMELAYILNNYSFIQNTNEQNCVYSAIGGYLATNKIHFVLVTAGPGVTNLITALSDAYLSNIPVFLISLNSNNSFYGLGNHHDSSTSPQGIDVVGLTKNITCFSSLCLNSSNAVYLINEAFKYALIHKKPVHINIPKNILLDEIKYFSSVDFNDLNFPKIFPKEIPYEIIDIIKNAKNPLIITSNKLSKEIFTNFIKKFNIIFANTMNNINFCCDLDFCFGNYEYIQSEEYKKIISKIDVVLFIGNNLNKYFVEDFGVFMNKKVVHISSDLKDSCILFSENYNFLNTEENNFFKILGDKLDKKYYENDFVAKYKNIIKNAYDAKYSNNLIYKFFEYFNVCVQENSSIFVDVGGVNNWVNLFLRPVKKVKIFLSSYFFNMGHSFKAVGYSFYNKNPNFIIIGDGAFYMNLNEIITIIQHDLPLTFVVVNNNGYASLISQYKKNKEIGNDGFCKYKKSLDFSLFCQSVGINYYLIDKIDNIKEFDKIDFEKTNLIEIKSEFESIIPL